jgi:DNA-3-methyladenine glycosylase II
VLLILEQQVSIDSAKATFNKIKATVLTVEPQSLIALTDEEFKSLGVSRQKTAYIKGLAAAVINKEIELETLPHKPAEVVREGSSASRASGIGPLTVYLMFSLEAPDIMPLGDIAVVNTIKELLDIHTKTEMERIATMGAYRSFATYLLWHHYLQKRNRKISYEL